MPQSDLTSFHGLIISAFILVAFVFVLTFNYLTPFWSLVNKLNSKKGLSNLFLKKQKQSMLISSVTLTGKTSSTI